MGFTLIRTNANDFEQQVRALLHKYGITTVEQLEEVLAEWVKNEVDE